MTEIEDGDEEKLQEAMSAHYKNVTGPVFSRWTSVIKTLKVFIKNWTSIYFLAVTVKQSTIKQKSSLLASYADSLLGHMNTRPSQDGYDILLDGDNNEQSNIPQTLYAQGLWILAFGESFFERHFAFLMHYDSKFGEDSFGHVARLYPERVYAMHRDLKQLEEQEGWKNDPAFAKYLEVVNKFPDASGGYRDDIKDGGKAFFRRAEGTFFENYRAQFNKHIASCVRISDKAATTTKGAPNTARLLPSIVGGHPELAREWATYLFIADERGEIDVGDDDEWFRHHFSKKEIVLDHNEGELPPIKIKVDDCMEYLTGEVNPFELLKIPMVKDNMDFLRRMAAVPDDVAAVDIFDNRTWPVGQDG